MESPKYDNITNFDFNVMTIHAGINEMMTSLHTIEYIIE